MPCWPEVPVLAPEGVSGRELIALVKQAGARGDYLSVSAQAHRELLDFLAANRKQYWTATFLDIMRHVKHRQAGRGAAARQMQHR
jgi:hypothetical protein